MARLLIRSEGFRDHIIELHLGLNRLGRSSENDFQIEHPTISARHCEVLLGDGKVTVRDCGSTNGTFVGDERIREASLHAGDRLYLGDVELLVESTEVTIAIPTFEVPRPAPPVVLSDGTLVCPRHPEAQATHQCTHCREVMCTACVHRLRRRGGKVLKLCPLCSHPCEPLGPGPGKKRKSILAFLQRTVKLPFLQGRKKTE